MYGRYDFARQLIVWQKNVIVWQNFANVWQNFVNVWQNLVNVWQNFVNDWQNFANHRLQIFARQLNIHMLCQTFCQTIKIAYFKRNATFDALEWINFGWFYLRDRIPIIGRQQKSVKILFDINLPKY